MLPNDELTQLRADLLTTLPDTCAILSVTRTPDGEGGITETWGTASASVPCRLDFQTGRKVLTGGALEPFSGYVLTLPYSATCTDANRVLHNGITYAVQPGNLQGSLIAVKRYKVERV